MTSQYISLGWYVRFVPLDAMEAMDRFHAEVLGMPRLWHSRIAHGKVENKDLYWAGETIIENHNCGAPRPAWRRDRARPTRPRRVRCSSTVSAISMRSLRAAREGGEGHRSDPLAPMAAKPSCSIP